MKLSIFSLSNIVSFANASLCGQKNSGPWFPKGSEFLLLFFSRRFQSLYAESLLLPLLTLEDEGGGENRHGQGDDPNQHAGIAGGGGIAAAGLNGHIGHVIEPGLAVEEAIVGSQSIVALLGGHAVTVAAGDVAEAAAVHIVAGQRIQNRQAVLDEAAVLGRVDAQGEIGRAHV